MSRISRLVVLVTAVASLVGAMSATAGAVTWHNTGSTAFTATTGPGTLSSTSVNLACASGNATGSAAGGTTVAAIYNVSGTLTYNSCLLAGQNVTVGCNYTLTGSTQPATNTITGNADVTCSLTLTSSGTKLCHISGAPHAIYANPGHRDATWGVLTVTASTLNVSGPSCPAGTNDTGSLTEGTFRVTAGSGGGGTMGPVLNRTA